ncbi:MAG: 50S ribosomal protein L6 [Prolixibacteraceae bacterium]|jgi:large subunit ribosomal protein L6|nr:50S ribosomal protein L6 [Prolixibacteraceae bacterium]MDI9563041.1 50S ribosomal protein L6 [Bacteroidota bacterium]NLS98840.1 50S ribosomal protein L6 [Bacteroidales bacterium]OQB80637.1 MAG: 50S ribosomal protein L6 [Bacteroidetes bacterium ADurb.Bin123]HNZ68124.1 50S ribosomal protein L6 [Prolixibacteraceae bacterium]
MSRIGKLPIEIPAGVQVNIGEDNTITVKGPLGTLTQQVDKAIKVTREDNSLHFVRPDDEKGNRSMHGLYRSLVNNMVTGVTKGFEVKLELIGVGFRVEQLPNNVLDLVLGYSHHIYLQLPPEITLEAKTEKRTNPYILMKCIDKQLLGQVAAKIRSFRKPEPYNGKGIKFVDEQLRRKAGKAAGVK